MPTVNPALPNDGEDADAADVSLPIQAILAVLNGHIDVDNLEPGAIPWSVMDPNITNAIPAAAMKDAGNIQIHRDEAEFDYVVPNTGVWSADAAGSTRAGSMTALTAYINGYRATISVVTAHLFTASKDTYVDIKLGADKSMSLVYTEVANNAASPALDTDSIRLAIVVTGASSIAAAASINQGQEDRVLPIRTSIPMQTTDELGNLICPRDPQRKLLCQRRITTSLTSLSATGTSAQLTGLVCPVIIPLGRKIEIEIGGSYLTFGGGMNAQLEIWDGVVGSGTKLNLRVHTGAASAVDDTNLSTGAITPTGATKTYNAGYVVSTNAFDLNAAAVNPVWFRVKLV
jgi:hypothetical protein